MTETKKEIPLEILKEANELGDMYSRDPRQNSFNALVLGKKGSGKSFLLRTCRKPVHIDSFDPGGTKGLKDEISKGQIIVDTRYESEDPRDPKMFEEWRRQMEKRVKMNYFDYLGTYALDSSTTWGESVMNWILKKAHIAGEAPRWAHDYVPQKVHIRNWVREMLDLPCDFIMTGHLEGEKDEVSGRMTYEYMTTGKGVILIPLLFDELYIMDPKESSKGTNYRILTKATGSYTACSRLAREGLLEQYEEANIKSILKKVGLSTQDKPLFNKGEQK